MSDIQRYKIVNTKTNTSFFFVDRAFKSASTDAKEYITRNKGKFTMKLYLVNNKPYGDRYHLIETIKMEK